MQKGSTNRRGCITPRIIFTSRYIKNAGKGQLRNLLHYMANRENAEGLELSPQATATQNQKQWIAAQLRRQPKLQQLSGYEIYRSAPTQENASHLIEQIAEDELHRTGGVEHYIGYLAKRPRAERGMQGHALWGASDAPINLQKVTQEVAAHSGRIWTHVISLRREDAERLGYDNAAAWRDLLREKSPELAERMGILQKDFVWYAAFHNEGHHPHIHVLCYSKNPKRGYLSKQGIDRLRSSFAKSIFADDLYYIYEQKDLARDALKQFFEDELEKALLQANQSNPKAEALLRMLAERLKTAKHRRVYGRLDKENRLLVDEIVREISRDKKVTMLYENWLRQKDAILFTYQNHGCARRGLADEPELRHIKNLVLKCALELSEQDEIAEQWEEIKTEQAEQQTEQIQAAEKEHRVRQQRKMQLRTAYLRLLKQISEILEDDFRRKQKQIAAVDKKQLRRIQEQKAALGHRF